jgi:sorbitol-specific phosphotransferase system component IIC
MGGYDAPAMITTIIPWLLLLFTMFVVYALVRKMIMERRLAALIRRQAHWRQQEEDAVGYE